VDVSQTALKSAAGQFGKSNSMGIRQTKGPGAPGKFIIVPPDASVPTVSTSPDDVATILLGPGDLSQLQITIHKD
jgi:hypothetical protein